MNEEDTGFGEYIAEIAVQATREAHLKARQIMDYVVISRNGYIIKLYSDDTTQLVKRVNGSTAGADEAFISL